MNEWKLMPGRLTTSTSMPERLGLSEIHIELISSPLTLPAGVLMLIGSLPLGMGWNGVYVDSLSSPSSLGVSSR